jgi:aflatoxin B1 aldehyde reductase
MMEALSKWEEAAKTERTTKADLAYRWVMYNSALEGGKGDALVIGASSLEQLEQTLEGVDKGGIYEEAVQRIDEI